jgi:transposase
MMSVMMSVTEPVRRFEVFTGAGHRRRWSQADKVRIVEESWSGAESVCSVARRHGLASTQLFAWRKEARERAATEPSFVPVLVETAGRTPAVAESAKKRRRSRDGGIELEIDGVVVRVGRGAEARTVAAVIKALKAQR